MTVLSAAYAAVARARRRSYERHPERCRRLCRPVVSVGNLSVGGSGKTPAVAHIARRLVAAGEHPSILTRGYRRAEPTDGVLVVGDGRRILADLPRAGDEPLMLARAVPGAAVLVGADRYLSGVLAERRLGCSVHLLDDGFQHVRLHRDVDIVLIRPQDLHDEVLPAGRLREERAALRRADAIVINGALRLADGREAARSGQAGGPGGEGDVAEARAFAEATGVDALFEARTWLQSAPVPKPVLALAGIARPRRFFDLLAASGSDLLLLPIQDVFGWRDRINVPGVVNDENWTWRMLWPSDRLLDDEEPRERAQTLREMCERHGRAPVGLPGDRTR